MVCVDLAGTQVRDEESDELIHIVQQVVYPGDVRCECVTVFIPVPLVEHAEGLEGRQDDLSDPRHDKPGLKEFLDHLYLCSNLYILLDTVSVVHAHLIPILNDLAQSWGISRE